MTTTPDHAGSGKGSENGIQTPAKPTFFGVPREIRDKIYTFALVDQGHFDPNDNWCVNETARASNPENGDPEEVIVAAHTPRTVGGILISEVQSKNAQHGWKRTSYPKPPKRLEEFTIDDITYVYETDSEDEKLPTTYHLASEVSLQLFYTCRQVYEEASVIFYGQNRFYIKEIHSLVPFLEDRPPSSRCLIRILSIRLLWDYIWANKTVPLTNTWADETVPLTSPERGAFPEACTYISGHAEFSNLKQLDLRTYAGGLHPKFLDNIKPDDILVKQLASIASPDIMTVSLMNWHPLVYTGKLLPIRKDVEKVIFAKLPNHLYGQIQRCREGITESEGDKDEAKTDPKASASAPDANPGPDSGSDTEEESDDEYDEDWSNEYEGGFQGSTMMGARHGEL